MINVAGAITYFGAINHTRSAVWSGFSSGNKQAAAVAEARRQLAREFGRALDDNEPAYVEGDTYREEYAVYELALYLLTSGQIANAENDPQPVLTGMAEVATGMEANHMPNIPDACLKWLNFSGRTIIRG